MQILARKIFLICLLAAILPACQPMPAGETNQSPAPSSPTSDRPAAASPVQATPGPSQASPVQPTPGPTQPSQGAIGLGGQVYAASDVSGQPDTPLPNQLVLAIPQATASGILGVRSVPDDEQLRFLKATIQQADPNMGVTVTDAQGNYALPLPPGDYLLCLGEENAITPVSFPVTTRGCGRVTVPAGGTKTVNVSSGFGEILLVEP